MLAEVTSEVEIQSVEEAIAQATPYGGVRLHLQQALALYADRKNPDYRNSIKESISAVESIAKHVSGQDKAKLKVILDKLREDGTVHPALANAFTSLFGYTSDADGIRHASKLDEHPTKSNAKFMLVCCSAFVHYVIENIGPVR